CIRVQRDTGSEFKTPPISCGSNPATGTQYTFTIPGCTAPPPDLTNWWPAEGNAHDIISHRNGSPVGGTSFASGEVGQAFSFDGSSGYVDLGAANLLGGATQATIDAWVYPTSFAGYQGIIYPGPTNIWWLQVLPTSGKIRFAISNGSTGSADSTNAIPLNQWS